MSENELDNKNCCVENTIVTIITTVYRKRKGLEDAVQSVKNQTYPNIEYIITDDGLNSVDDATVQSWLDNSDSIKALTIIHNEKNMGTSATMNKAIAQSHGKYIFVLADDDAYYDSNVIADCVDLFRKSGADVICGRREVFDEDMQTSFGLLPTDDEMESYSDMSPKDLLILMESYNRIFGCTTARTREIATQIPFNEKYTVIEDYPNIMDILRSGASVLFYDRVMIKYRGGGSSSSTSINRNYLKETNSIFWNEVYPHTDNRLRALIKHYKVSIVNIMILIRNELRK